MEMALFRSKHDLERARTLGLGFRASQEARCNNKVTGEGSELGAEVTERGIHHRGAESTKVGMDLGLASG